MKTFNPKDIEPRFFYRLLSGIVSPRPIALVSSCDKQGNVNLAPFSFFNVMSINPPVLVFSPLRRLRTNTTKDTLNNIQDLKEVVINITGFSTVEQMSITGDDYGSDVNEFTKSGFTPISSQMVTPPRVKEALASFECKVSSIVSLGEEGGAGNLVICEVLTSHFKEGVVGDEYQINVESLDLIARLGQDYYTKVTTNSLFQVKKQSNEMGIGWDNLPTEVKESEYLHGNEISKLATVKAIPVDVQRYKFELNATVYKEVKKCLDKNEVEKAWSILYSNLI